MASISVEVIAIVAFKTYKRPTSLETDLFLLFGRVLNVWYFNFNFRTVLRTGGGRIAVNADERRTLWDWTGMNEWSHNATLSNVSGWTWHPPCKRRNWLHGIHGWNPNHVAWISHLKKPKKYKYIFNETEFYQLEFELIMLKLFYKWRTFSTINYVFL